jgi:hypothetical protein
MSVERGYGTIGNNETTLALLKKRKPGNSALKK